MAIFKRKREEKRKKKGNLLKEHLGLSHLKILSREVDMLILRGNGKCLPNPALWLMFETILPVPGTLFPTFSAALGQRLGRLTWGGGGLQCKLPESTWGRPEVPGETVQ